MARSATDGCGALVAMFGEEREQSEREIHDLQRFTGYCRSNTIGSVVTVTSHAPRGRRHVIDQS